MQQYLILIEQKTKSFIWPYATKFNLEMSKQFFWQESLWLVESW